MVEKLGGIPKFNPVECKKYYGRLSYSPAPKDRSPIPTIRDNVQYQKYFDKLSKIFLLRLLVVFYHPIFFYWSKVILKITYYVDFYLFYKRSKILKSL